MGWFIGLAMLVALAPVAASGTPMLITPEVRLHGYHDALSADAATRSATSTSYLQDLMPACTRTCSSGSVMAVMQPRTGISVRVSRDELAGRHSPKSLASGLGIEGVVEACAVPYVCVSGDAAAAVDTDKERWAVAGTRSQGPRVHPDAVSTAPRHLSLLLVTRSSPLRDGWACATLPTDDFVADIRLPEADGISAAESLGEAGGAAGGAGPGMANAVPRPDHELEVTVVTAAGARVSLGAGLAAAYSLRGQGRGEQAEPTTVSLGLYGAGGAKQLMDLAASSGGASAPPALVSRPALHCSAQTVWWPYELPQGSGAAWADVSGGLLSDGEALTVQHQGAGAGAGVRSRGERLALQPGRVKHTLQPDEADPAAGAGASMVVPVAAMRPQDSAGVLEDTGAAGEASGLGLDLQAQDEAEAEAAADDGV